MIQHTQKSEANLINSHSSTEKTLSLAERMLAASNEHLAQQTPAETPPLGVQYLYTQWMNDLLSGENLPDDSDKAW